MRILFAGVELAGWSSNPAKGVTVNGQMVYEAIDIVAASRKRLFNRGNEIVTLSFAVTRQFATLKEAEVFVVSGYSAATKSGLCEVQCGQSIDYQSVYLAGAMLSASPVATYRGLSVDVAYQIVAPGADTDDPPQFLTGGEDMILRGSDAIGSGATYLDVTFSTPFASAPVVNATVAMPSGGDHIWPTVRDDLVTVNGFRAEFSGTIPATGYKLNWSAIG